MCSYPCFGLSKTDFTPPSQLLKLIKKPIKKWAAMQFDAEIGSENCVAADAEIGSENWVINSIYIVRTKENLYVKNYMNIIVLIYIKS